MTQHNHSCVFQSSKIFSDKSGLNSCFMSSGHLIIWFAWKKNIVFLISKKYNNAFIHIKKMLLWSSKIDFCNALIQRVFTKVAKHVARSRRNIIFVFIIAFVLVYQSLSQTRRTPWASYQIRKIAGCANPRWRGKHSRYFRRMRNTQFWVSAKTPMLEDIGGTYVETCTCIYVSCKTGSLKSPPPPPPPQYQWF